MLTPFGKEIRKLRIDKGMRLLDLADQLNVSPAFVSAIETGRKAVPADYVTSVARAMKLSKDESVVLQRVADQSRTQVPVGKLPGDQRELLAAFARRVDEVPQHVLDALKKAVLESIDSETPFHRHRRGLLVAPASTTWLREFAEYVRSVFVDADDVRFPIMEVLENKLGQIIDGFYLDVWTSKELGHDEGRVTAGENCIVLRDDVYRGAWTNVGRHRFTAGHELAHFLLHRKVTLARTREDNHPIYRDAEWQADTFAGTLLMSPRHARHFTGPRDAAARCGITVAAATVMLSKYAKGATM